MNEQPIAGSFEDDDRELSGTLRQAVEQIRRVPAPADALQDTLKLRRRSSII